MGHPEVSFQMRIELSTADPSRYWDQRYSIWSLYDEGIVMTDDSWFGVTPESVAKYAIPSPTHHHH